MFLNRAKLFLIVISLRLSLSFDIEFQPGNTPDLSSMASLGRKENMVTTHVSHAENTRNRRQLNTVSLVFTDLVNGTIYKKSGESVTLKCETKGSPTPNITWYKNNIAPVSRSVFPVTYDKWSLLMKELRSYDSGKYRCRVCYKKDCVEREYTLNVTEISTSLPTIKVGFPENTTVRLGRSAVLSCPTVDDVEHATKWLRNGTNVNFTLQHNRANNLQKKYVLSDDTLTINDVKKDDEGWYKCTTSNKDGEDTGSGYLSVIGIGVVETGGSKSKIIAWLIPSLVILIIICLSMTMVFVKFRRKNANRPPLEMNEVTAEQWKKIISIERTKSNGYIADCGVQTPIVKIERKKLSDVKELMSSVNETDYVLPVDTTWEISRKDLYLGKVLGAGEFGKVVQGTLSYPTPCTVAVKMLREGHTDADMVAFVSELEIMKMVGKHENIINLLGCCSQDGPLHVIVEFAQNGCLRDFLRKHKPHVKNSSTEQLMSEQLSQSELIEFSWQVAKGMEYLTSRGVIHRDLAARNVLVSAQRVLKVADFGLARDLRESDYYRKRTAGKLPMKWMAPESLVHNFYSMKSDVWSYGVLMWEIMSLGKTPYPQIPVHYLYQYLKMGKRMDMPEDCRQDIYELMKHCWSFKPDDRPTFTEVKEKQQEIYSSS